MIRLLGYRQGLTRFFQEADFLQSNMRVRRHWHGTLVVFI